MNRFLDFVFLTVAFAGSAAAADLMPASVEQAFVTPGESVTMKWTIPPSGPGGPLPFVVRQFTGVEVLKGEAARPAADSIAVTLKLERGFFEIEFPTTKQRFGIVSLPRWEGAPDRFFAVDGGLSWLVHDDRTRAGLIAVAKRSGIGMIRERLTWGAVNPAPDQWDWETPRHFDTLRQAYADQSVPILEMAHDGPAWMGHVVKYPSDLNAAARSWKAIAAHWGKAWGALEVWNEPDIDFGGNLPADQYVMLAKALAYEFQHEKIDVPLVGGVLAYSNPDFMKSCAENGLLDRMNIFSFHTYDKASAMEGIVTRYRHWLRASGHSAMPLWITECGRPWKTGPERPPIDQDAASALDITMKAVEARACGIARYFAFVYPFYEENVSNFGMMDKRATPLASFGAYAQMCRALGKLEYLGDLSLKAPGIKRARVFGDERQAVAVLYSGHAAKGATVTLALPVQGIEGIDGRTLNGDAPGVIPIPDGLTYARLDREKANALITTDTVAGRLHADRGAASPKPELAPIVIRFEYQEAKARPSSKGYWLSPDQPEVDMAVRVFNLSDRDRPVRVHMSLPRKTAEAKFFSVTGNVPAASHVVLRAPLRQKDLFAESERAQVQIVAEDEAGKELDRLVIDFHGEPDLDAIVSKASSAVKLPIGDSARWSPGVNAGGHIEMKATPESGWQMKFEQKQRGDRWAYPTFRLPDDVHMEKAVSLLIRARCEKAAAVRVFLWEGETGVGYITPASVIPADGKWHTARVNFQELAPSSANASDSNGKLDLDTVRRISIGMNSEKDQNLLDVSDVRVLGPPR